MLKTTFALAAALALAACSKDKSYESGGTTDTTQGSSINIGITTDTVNVPTFGTVKDTVIVDKPVVTGRKPVEVKRPTVTKTP
jgi:hypothetical protein